MPFEPWNRDLEALGARNGKTGSGPTITRGIGRQQEHLDLAHNWATASDTTSTATHGHAGALALKDSEDSRCSKGSKAEPEESGGSLSLVAALGSV